MSEQRITVEGNCIKKSLARAYVGLNAFILDRTPLKEMSRFHAAHIFGMEGFMRQRQYRWFEELFNEHAFRSVGETGFNGGHSAFAFAYLGAESITSFDLMEHPYVAPASEMLKKRFPSTSFNLIGGDSTQTVPQYSITSGFDLVFIDGGHSLEVAKSDVISMHKHAQEGSIVVVDDYGTGRASGVGPKLAYDHAVSDGMIEPIDVISGNLSTWAVGSYRR